MERFWFFISIFLIIGSKLFAQDTDLQLAKQYTANGDQQKAVEIYQKLFKQDNETYFPVFFNSLVQFKKYDEAIGMAKKMIRTHPENQLYTIMLGTAYTQQGNIEKADALYDNLIKNLPADQNQISMLASQFYQNANIEYAIKIFQQGRKLLQNEQIFAYELINLYRFKRDKAALITEYLNFLPSNPSFISQAENMLSTLFEGPTDYDLLQQELIKKYRKNLSNRFLLNCLPGNTCSKKNLTRP